MVAQNAAEVIAAVRPVLEHTRILIAEDQKAIRRVVRMMLEKAGATVLEAENGREAERVLLEGFRNGEPIDLAFLDLMMPDVNGLECLRWLRNNPRLFRTPVIIMTAVKDRRIIQECSRLGAARYILKPPSAEKILFSAGEIIEEMQPVDDPGAAEDAASAAPPDDGEEEEGGPDIASDAPTGEEKTAGSNGASGEDDSAHDASRDEESEGGAEAEAAKVEPVFPLEYGNLPEDKSYALRPGYFRCPWCETLFTAPRLVNRALKPVKDDPYALGLYDEGQNREYLDYSLVEMLSCPTCLYTSDRGGFSHISPKVVSPKSRAAAKDLPSEDWVPVFFETNPRMIEAMMATRDDRIARARKAGREGIALFRIDDGDPESPRRPADALVAINLALASYRTMLEFFREETEARIRQKRAGFLLRKARLLEKMKARAEPGEEPPARTMRRKAFEELLEINEIEFRVIAERLHCLNRRFHLADELLPGALGEATMERYEKERKKAFAAMKSLLTEVRGEYGKGSYEYNTTERFLQPLEDRMVELEKQAS